MIAVAAMNSAVDKLLDVEALAPGSVLRTRDVRAWPGGKGVHVATCAAVFGQNVRLTGLVDDVHREWFAAWLRARGVDFHGIDTPTPIRTCLAIRESDGRITEILEPGPAVDVEIAESAFHIAVNVCRKASVAVLTGSLPPGITSDTYSHMIRALARGRRHKRGAAQKRRRFTAIRDKTESVGSGGAGRDPHRLAGDRRGGSARHRTGRGTACRRVARR